MINSISNSAASTPVQAQRTQSHPPPAKPKSTAPQDSVVLSKKAAATIDADHDGDSH